jgi:hypothetical protein
MVRKHERASLSKGGGIPYNEESQEQRKIKTSMGEDLKTKYALAESDI